MHLIGYTINSTKLSFINSAPVTNRLTKWKTIVRLSHELQAQTTTKCPWSPIEEGRMWLSYSHIENEKSPSLDGQIAFPFIQYTIPSLYSSERDMMLCRKKISLETFLSSNVWFSFIEKCFLFRLGFVFLQNFLSIPYIWARQPQSTWRDALGFDVCMLHRDLHHRLGNLRSRRLF